MMEETYFELPDSRAQERGKKVCGSSKRDLGRGGVFFLRGKKRARTATILTRRTKNEGVVFCLGARNKTRLFQKERYRGFHARRKIWVEKRHTTGAEEAKTKGNLDGADGVKCEDAKGNANTPTASGKKKATIRTLEKLEILPNRLKPAAFLALGRVGRKKIFKTEGI